MPSHFKFIWKFSFGIHSHLQCNDSFTQGGSALFSLFYCNSYRLYLFILFESKDSIVCFLFLSFLHSLCKLLSISFYYFDQFYIYLCHWKLCLRSNFGAYQRKQQTTTITTNNQQPTTIRKLLQASIRANKTGHFIWVASDRYFN